MQVAASGVTTVFDCLRLGTVTEIGLDDRVSLDFATDTLLSSDRTEFSAKASLNIAF